MTDPRGTAALLESTPRAALDRMLGYMVGHHRATGALIASEDGMLQMVRTVRPPRVARFDVMLTVHRPALERGETARGEDFVLLPLGQPFAGVLWLDDPKAWRDDDVDVWRWKLGTAFAAAMSDSAGWAETIHVDRKRLAVRLMDAYEGNVSMVARKMATTRKTVYELLKRAGYDKKPPRG